MYCIDYFQSVGGGVFQFGWRLDRGVGWRWDRRGGHVGQCLSRSVDESSTLSVQANICPTMNIPNPRYMPLPSSPPAPPPSTTLHLDPPSQRPLTSARQPNSPPPPLVLSLTVSLSLPLCSSPNDKTSGDLAGVQPRPQISWVLKYFSVLFIHLLYSFFSPPSLTPLFPPSRLFFLLFFSPSTIHRCLTKAPKALRQGLTHSLTVPCFCLSWQRLVQTNVAHSNLSGFGAIRNTQCVQMSLQNNC